MEILDDTRYRVERMALARDYPELVESPQEDAGALEEIILELTQMSITIQEEQEC